MFDTKYIQDLSLKCSAWNGFINFASKKIQNKFWDRKNFGSEKNQGQTILGQKFFFEKNYGSKKKFDVKKK